MSLSTRTIFIIWGVVLVIFIIFCIVRLKYFSNEHFFGIGDPIVGNTASSTTVPNTTVPNTTVPNTTVPNTTVPNTTVPNTTVPNTTVPNTTTSITTVPSTTVPNTTVPNTTTSITTVPSTTTSITTVPSTTESTTTEPNITEPNITEHATVSNTIPTTTPVQRIQKTLPQVKRVQKKPAEKQTPVKTNYSLINYVDDVMQQGDLKSIPGCDKLFDDHVAVQRLGYSNCQEAYGDYIEKNLDTKKLYDTSRSLEDMCPITTKSPKYMKCLNDLYGKFNTNNNMLDGITGDVSNIINNRLAERDQVLMDIDKNYARNMSQIPVPTHIINSNIADTSENKLYAAEKYFTYKNLDFDIPMKNRSATVESFTNPETTRPTSQTTTRPTSQTTTHTTTNTSSNKQLNMANPTEFIGTYKPKKGQYLLFADARIDLSRDSVKISKDGELYATYKVLNIAGSDAFPDTIVVLLESVKVNTDPENFAPLKNILDMIGITPPCKLYLTRDEYVSTEKVKHISYKISNDSHDTIMYLEKV